MSAFFAGNSGRRTAIVVGFDYHASLFSGKMNAHSKTWRFVVYPSTKSGLLRAILRMPNADAVIRFGGPAPHPTLMAAARANRVPIFVIWAGTDVSLVLEHPNRLSQVQRSSVTHLAVAPWLTEELKQAGISARYIPIIGMTTDACPEIPLDQLNVLTYLPEPRRDFYGRPHVYEVARRLPDVNFLIVGAGSPDPGAPANARYLGWLSDIGPTMDRCAALLRVPDHDGMSLVVLEALAKGRHVAWKYVVPGVRQVATPDDTFRFLVDLRERLATNPINHNTEGMDFIKERYDERHVALEVENFLNRSIPDRRTVRPVLKRMAISGLDIFAADIARLNNELPTGWDAEVLQLESSYAALGSLTNLLGSDALYTIGTPTLGRTLNFIMNFTRKPRVMHWVGSDIEVASRDERVQRRIASKRITHLTEVEWEAEELRKLGIEAKIAPLPPRFTCSSNIPPLPSRFGLLAYLPRSRTDFYGRGEVEALMHVFRNQPITFLIVGGGRVDVPSGVVVEDLGWRYSMHDVYEKTTALFRFTPRDGLSLMVLEALSFGRRVLWTKPFPYVDQVSSVEDAARSLTALLDLFKKGGLSPQTEGARFVQTQYDRARCMRRISSYWDSATRSD